jgi:hypothetical protein
MNAAMNNDIIETTGHCFFYLGGCYDLWADGDESRCKDCCFLACNGIQIEEERLLCYAQCAVRCIDTHNENPLDGEVPEECLPTDPSND